MRDTNLMKIKINKQVKFNPLPPQIGFISNMGRAFLSFIILLFGWVFNYCKTNLLDDCH